MTARARFLFDNDFGGAVSAGGEAVLSTRHQTGLAEAEARGYRNGLAAGKAEAAAETHRQMAAGLVRAAEALNELARSFKAVEAHVQSEAIEIAVAFARKLAPALVAREPLAEITALAAECLRHLGNAPHVVLRVNDALFEPLRTQLADLAARSNFEAKMIVLADTEIAVGDCRVEWADGGVTRCRASTESAIVDAVDRYIAARGRMAGYEPERGTP